MNRQEHLEWSKKRAMEYVDNNDFEQAYTSMASDLGKHPDTSGHIGIMLGMQLLMAGKLSTVNEITDYIKGFN